jgi:hypothetical protein
VGSLRPRALHKLIRPLIAAQFRALITTGGYPRCAGWTGPMNIAVVLRECVE